jgi:hypothetical protein
VIIWPRGTNVRSRRKLTYTAQKGGFGVDPEPTQERPKSRSAVPLAVTNVCYPAVKRRRGAGAMKLARRQFLNLAAGAAALPAMSRIARAQTYPIRPITIFVPFAAGGPADTLGRILVERMRAPLGQPVIIENVAGAAGTIALTRVARAAPMVIRSVSAIGVRILSPVLFSRFHTTC